MKIVVYGNGDKDEKTGFPTKENFIDYIKEDIFTNFKADIIIASSNVQI